MATLSQKTFTIKKTINGLTLNFLLQPNVQLQQIFTRDKNTYAPDYAVGATNLILTPTLLVSGLTGDQSENLSAFAWTVKKQDGTAASQTLTAGTGNAKKLTSNLTDCTGLTITCNATYTDPTTGVATPVTASINVMKTENAGANIIAIPYTPLGDTFVNDTTSLKVHCDLWRGGDIDSTAVTYKWEMLVSGAWTTLNSTTNYGITGYTTNEITVPASAITNVGVLKCTIQDTDTGSSTYNKTASAIQTLYDGTDPYDIAILMPNGDGVVSGGSVGVQFKVLQGGAYVTDSAFLTARSCKFWRYTAAGVMDTTFGTSGYKPATYDATNFRWTASIAYADLLSASQAFCVELN